MFSVILELLVIWIGIQVAYTVVAHIMVYLACRAMGYKNSDVYYVPEFETDDNYFHIVQALIRARTRIILHIMAIISATAITFGYAMHQYWQ